jgi:hypothetical protein
MKEESERRFSIGFGYPPELGLQWASRLHGCYRKDEGGIMKYEESERRFSIGFE